MAPLGGGTVRSRWQVACFPHQSRPGHWEMTGNPGPGSSRKTQRFAGLQRPLVSGASPGSARRSGEEIFEGNHPQRVFFFCKVQERIKVRGTWTVRTGRKTGSALTIQAPTGQASRCLMSSSSVGGEGGDGTTDLRAESGSESLRSHQVEPPEVKDASHRHGHCWSSEVQAQSWRIPRAVPTPAHLAVQLGPHEAHPPQRQEPPLPLLTLLAAPRQQPG